MDGFVVMEVAGVDTVVFSSLALQDSSRREARVLLMTGALLS